MEEPYSKIRLQFEGFISTPHLWKRKSFYGLRPFLLPLKNSYSGLNPEKIFSGLQLNHVLGKRAETFFELAINASGQFEVVASRIQISRERITIGELDFLLKDKMAISVRFVPVISVG